MATAIRDCQLEDLMLWMSSPEWVLANSPVVIWRPLSRGGTGRAGPPYTPSLHDILNVEDAVELEFAILDPNNGELREGRVSIIVEAPGAQNAPVVLRGEDLLYHLFALHLTILARTLYGVEHYVGRLVGVGGVSMDLAVLLLELLDELLTLGGECARRHPTEGNVGPLGGGSPLSDERVDVDAVRADEGDVIVGHPGADLVFDELASVVLDDAAEVDGVGVRLFDLVHQRAVVGGRAVYALAPEDLYVEELGILLDLIREPLAVSLLVVEDVDRFDSLLIHQLGGSSALLVVGHDHASVIALARRVVLLRLGRIGAGLGEADVGVGGADHAELGFIEDRDLYRRATGVEGPDPADDLLVLGGFLGVLGALGLIPLPGLGCGIIHGLVLDLDV